MVTSAHFKSHFKFKQNRRRTDVLCYLTSEVREKNQELHEVHYVHLLKDGSKSIKSLFYLYLLRVVSFFHVCF